MTETESREHCEQLGEDQGRKRSEEALRESQGKLNAILGSVPDHISVLDGELNIVWANAIATGVFGKDIVGKKCYEAYHRRNKPCEPYPCLVLKTFQDGTIHEHDTEVVNKEGNTIYFHCTSNVASSDKDNKPVTVLEISRDITDRKRTEQLLGEELEQKRVLFEQCPDGIVIIDPETARILDFNTAAHLQLGYSREEFARLTVFDVEEKETREEIRARFEALTQKDTDDFETVQRTKEGDPRDVHVKVQAIEIRGRRVHHCVSRDITSRKRMEEELRMHRDSLSRLVAERTAALREEVERRKEREKELSVKSKTLEEVNATLRVLLKQREKDKEELEDQFAWNIRTMVLPYIRKIRKDRPGPRHAAYLNVVEVNLTEILSPFLNTMKQFDFTPKEAEVVSFIREGKTTKDIAGIMGVAKSAVDSHRDNIRKKLGLNNKKANLRTHLLSLK